MLRRGRDQPASGAEEVEIQKTSKAVPLSVAFVLFVGLSWVLLTNPQMKDAIFVMYGQASGALGMQAPEGGPQPVVLVPDKGAIVAVKAAPVAAEKAAPVADKKVGTRKVIATVHVKVQGKNTSLQIFDEPIPEYCNPVNHLDVDGDAVLWGLGNKAISAAECCKQCTTFNSNLKEGEKRRCHSWTWCGDPSGVCWTMDIHDHTTGDCWLKYQAQWDGITDLKTTNLKINHRDKFSDAFKAEHKTAPDYVPWISGLINPKLPTPA